MYDEFRISVAPAVEKPGQWTVRILQSPISSQERRGGNATPSFRREQLCRLRGRSGWPNIGQLQDIGAAAWHSIMEPIWDSFRDAQQVARTRGHRLRVVFVVHVVDNEADIRPDDPETRTEFDGAQRTIRDEPSRLISMRELPFEVTSHSGTFLATDLDTPVSRGLSERADRLTTVVAPPLRVLVVVSRPKDKPRGTEEDEAKVISTLLASFPVHSGYISLRHCDPPTRDALYRELAQGADVLHFIGHGGFYPIAGDPTPRAHLCLEDGTDRKSDPIDAYMLSMALKGSGVRLAVLNACSTAAESPYDGNGSAHSLLSVAQSIVKYDSEVTAAIGMQFDLEQNAACTFSSAFYQNLLSPTSAGNVDEAVTAARRTLSLNYHPGHRVWVTPAVYWRCADAKVFDLTAVMRPLDPEQQRKLANIDGALSVHRDNLQRYRPAGYRGLEGVCRAWIEKVDALSRLRGELLGDSLSASSGITTVGSRTRIAMSLHITYLRSFEAVRVEVGFPSEDLRFISVTSAKLTATVASTSGRVSVVMLPTQTRGTFVPGTHEAASLEYEVSPESTCGLRELRIESAQLLTDGRAIDIPCTNGVLMVVDAASGLT